MPTTFCSLGMLALTTAIIPQWLLEIMIKSIKIAMAILCEKSIAILLAVLNAKSIAILFATIS